MKRALEAVIVELKSRKLHGASSVRLVPDRVESLKKALEPWLAPGSVSTPAEADRPRLTVSSDRDGPSVFTEVLDAATSPDRKPKAKSEPRGNPATAPLVIPELSIPTGSTREQLDWLEARMKSCPLVRKEIGDSVDWVMGKGALDAEILLCGERPVEEDIAAGHPFAGEPGELLDKIVSAAGWGRHELYHTCAVKWSRPADLARGTKEEGSVALALAQAFLKAEISILKPRFIVCLGRVAIESLLESPDQTPVVLKNIHGRWFESSGIPVLPTYHPSYLLHNPSKRAKRVVWEDILLLMKRAGKPISEKQQNYFL